ncbi:MAG: sporulation protein YqfD [Oscillospiraceae bacterium]|jgi:similar to stage IV sporulation protein|nr:sporulation protein YqfD [Oscillospiraceae bacterium]
MGYVMFTAKGGFPERFINLCANSMVPLWDVKCTSTELRACTTIKGYKSIRRPARKSGMLPHISNKKGLPFFLNRYRRRAGLLAGAAIALVIIGLLSSMLWTIEITGNEKVENEEILLVLEELGVKKGVFKASIDTTWVEERLLETFTEISWSALNILGSKATLEVRERVEPPEMFDSSSPCNIIASQDGEIVKIEASSGNPAVQPGSAVVKGDLLISGVLQSKYHVLYVHAKGTVLAQTKRQIESRTEKQFSGQNIGEEKLRSTLYLFGIRIPLGKAAEEYDEYANNESFLVAADTVLPIGVIRERYSTFAAVSTPLSDDRAALISMANYYYEYKEALGDAEILSSDLQMAQEAGACVIKGSYRAEESIGAEQPFEVETRPNAGN